MPVEARIDESHDSFVRNRVRVIVFGSGTAEGTQVFEQRIDYELGGIADSWEAVSTGPARRDGYPPFVLDVPEYVAQAVYTALKARFDPAPPPVSADAYKAVKDALDRETTRFDTVLPYLLEAGRAAIAPPVVTTEVIRP